MVSALIKKDNHTLLCY